MIPATATPARTHALLVGIEQYKSGMKALDGPAHDVIGMWDWLTVQGVPPAQIRVLASPLPANDERLRRAGIPFQPATAEAVRDTLLALHDQHGDLLVLFWAGHGAINERQHRLFVSDATTADKRNFEWERIREVLASTFFRGFPRQIAFIDACANYLDDFEFSADGEPLRSGDPMGPRECAQFVLFAAGPGQTAKNLGAEKRGLFSRELLRVLEVSATGSWPPDMMMVVDLVRASFERMRVEDESIQMPRFAYLDWDGNEQNWGGPTRAQLKDTESRPVELPFPDLVALSTALMACGKLRSENGRNDVVRALRPDVANSVERSGNAKSDVMNIVQSACRYAGGLEELLVVVHQYEGHSLAWTRVEEYISGPLRQLGIRLDGGR